MAQGTGVSFGVLQTDTSQPVDITSDNMSVNQEDGSALLTGSVLIIQGEMRLSADNVLVVRRAEGNGIERLEARGNVLLVSGEDAAEAREADYGIAGGKDFGMLFRKGKEVSKIPEDRLVNELFDMIESDGVE